jgi:uncharacterized membrane protein YdbT with pleckstrin-like domain
LRFPNATATTHNVQPQHREVLIMFVVIVVVAVVVVVLLVAVLLAWIPKD